MKDKDKDRRKLAKLNEAIAAATARAREDTDRAWNRSISPPNITVFIDGPTLVVECFTPSRKEARLVESSICDIIAEQVDYMREADDWRGADELLDSLKKATALVSDLIKR